MPGLDEDEDEDALRGRGTLPSAEQTNHRTRPLYLVLGWFFFVLGAIGLLLPVVPTSPFMLLAAWAFSKSSKKFEQWLLNHRWFGPGIQRWRQHRVIPAKAKLMALGAMSVTFIASVLSGKIPWWGLLGQGLLMGYGAWFVARCPSRIPEDKVESSHDADA